MNRRVFLAKAGVAVGGAAVALPLVGCERTGLPRAEKPLLAADTTRAESAPAPDRTQRLVAEEGDVSLPGGRTWRTWSYGGQYPGPEIRVREGERLRVTVENRLPEGTTVHWHGVPVPNAMDGVPNLTQQPIAPGGAFTYEFEAAPAGTYMYHSHVGLQLDRALLGPLIVEERTPHVDYDREHVLMLDDFLAGPPEPLGEGRGGMMRGPGRGMMGGQVPPYKALLVNGHRPEEPPTFEVRQGERVRMRLLNPSSATTFRVAIGGHRLRVTHADGRPVEPVEVDSLRIGMGERYDVVVVANRQGAWPIAAATVEGDSPPARAVLKYEGSRMERPPEGLPEGLRGGRRLRYADLQSVETLPVNRADRTFDLTLSGGMMMQRGWTINGERYPDAAPLEIRSGERVRFRMVNHSMMLHPMHLHGHFFRVGGALKDTVLVDPHMGQEAFTFDADNPGRWFFHCHNLYHLEAGMAREVRYV